MALTVSFTAQQLLSGITNLVINDTSTGSDPAVTQRRIYLGKSDGTYLVPSGTSTTYITWLISAGSTVTISGILDKDYALNIQVDFLNASNTVLYTTNAPYGFTAYAESFDTLITQAQTANPNLIGAANWLNAASAVRTYIDNASQAIIKGGDIVAAQLCLSKAKWIKDNVNLLF